MRCWRLRAPAAQSALRLPRCANPGAAPHTCNQHLVVDRDALQDRLQVRVTCPLALSRAKSASHWEGGRHDSPCTGNRAAPRTNWAGHAVCRRAHVRGVCPLHPQRHRGAKKHAQKRSEHDRRVGRALLQAARPHRATARAPVPDTPPKLARATARRWALGACCTHWMLVSARRSAERRAPLGSRVRLRNATDALVYGVRRGRSRVAHPFQSYDGRPDATWRALSFIGRSETPRSGHGGLAHPGVARVP